MGRKIWESSLIEDESNWSKKIEINGNFLDSLTLPPEFIFMEASPDLQKIAVWTELTEVRFYDISFSLIGEYKSDITPEKNSTERVPFSADSSLAVVETGRLNPIAVINLTDFSSN